MPSYPHGKGFGSDQCPLGGQVSSQDNVCSLGTNHFKVAHATGRTRLSSVAPVPHTESNLLDPSDGQDAPEGASLEISPQASASLDPLPSHPPAGDSGLDFPALPVPLPADGPECPPKRRPGTILDGVRPFENKRGRKRAEYNIIVIVAEGAYGNCAVTVALALGAYDWDSAPRVRPKTNNAAKEYPSIFGIKCLLMLEHVKCRQELCEPTAGRGRGDRLLHYPPDPWPTSVLPATFVNMSPQASGAGSVRKFL